MEHAERLVSLLRPLGVYDLRRGAINREELEIYGAQLDGELEGLDETAREMVLTTAESFGLENIEALLPYRPVSETVEQRRQALAALLRIGGDSFTLAAINDTISGCGINAHALETGRPGYVQVYFPDVPGVPEQFEQLRMIIEEILPCHLEVEYTFWYNSWGRLMGLFDTWGQAMDGGPSWDELAAINNA